MYRNIYTQGSFCSTARSLSLTAVVWTLSQERVMTVLRPPTLIEDQLFQPGKPMLRVRRSTGKCVRKSYDTFPKPCLVSYTASMHKKKPGPKNGRNDFSRTEVGGALSAAVQLRSSFMPSLRSMRSMRKQGILNSSSSERVGVPS